MHFCFKNLKITYYITDTVKRSVEIMRRYGCTKRNPDPKWPYEQAVIAVPKDSQVATAAKMNNTLKVLESADLSEEIRTESLGENEEFFREKNMPIMGFDTDGIAQKRGTLEKLENRICPENNVSSYLCQKVGNYAKVEFLFGENTHVEKSGILESVGKDFIVLTESGTNARIVCSAKYIKFINIYNFNNG